MSWRVFVKTLAAPSVLGSALCALTLAVASTAVQAAVKRTHRPTQQRAAMVEPGVEPEARLTEIYAHLAVGHHREAMRLAAELTQSVPNFQPGQLIYGDLLRLHTRPVHAVGDVPAPMLKNGAHADLQQLREEVALRMRARAQRPPPGTIPSQLIGLAPRNKHVIVVDTGKARLYLLENSASGMRIVEDHYVSIGQQGADKFIEGDNKTPLGLYFLTSTLDSKGLPPLYGGGALPINYPNAYDLYRGKTGSGIWLHGSPPEQYARLPRASNGCIVLANVDINKLMAKVAIRTTAVIIASHIEWVSPAALHAERKRFEVSLGGWRNAKNVGDLEKLRNFYVQESVHYENQGKIFEKVWTELKKTLHKADGRTFEWRDTSALMWRPEQGNQNAPPVMVVTYDERHPSADKAVTRRQYWILVNDGWKIFYEGTIPA